jgi:hypothetical protein
VCTFQEFDRSPLLCQMSTLLSLLAPPTRVK